MRLSGGRIWLTGLAWALPLCLVLGALVGFFYGFATEYGPDELFQQEGRFVVANGVVGAFVGVGVGLLVCFPAAIVATGLFAWLVSRRDPKTLSSGETLRLQAVVIGAGLQLAALAWFGWEMNPPESRQLGAVLALGSAVLLAAAVSAWLGPHLVGREVARQARAVSMPASAE
jgi:hypothetical protein